MNRMYRQFKLGLENRGVELFMKVAIGAVGAPTIKAGECKGVASISRSSAGKYVITLQDAYVDLLNVQSTRILAAGSPASGGLVVRDNSVSSSKQLTVEFQDGAFLAADLASGTTLLLKIELLASGR